MPIMRIAVAGLHTECSTYNPVLIPESAFRQLRGQQLVEDPHFAFLKDYPAEYVPILHARAVPGGPVARSAYEHFKDEIIDNLRINGPYDGVYLAMHGAMFVDGMEDAEGDFLSAVRAIVDIDTPISVSYDLHGNLSQRIIDAIDMFSTYRTAPHIDVEETMRRSIAMLMKRLENGAKPKLLWVPIPVLVPGERSSTVDEPAKSLYAQLPELEAPEGIWDASLQVGYVWADEPRATAAAVFTGIDLPAMEQAAKQLARNYWDVRRQFAFGTKTGTLEECVGWAVASETRPVVLAESGDNPTGGGVGDRAEMFAALLVAGATETIFAGICDKPATKAAYAAGLGATLELSIGATLDPASTPARVRAEVKFLLGGVEGDFREAVLQVDGIDLVVTARRRPFHNIEDFTRLGLDPLGAKIVAVKSGYLSPELAPIANPSLMALTEGVVDQYVERLPRLRKDHPIFPFDDGFEFTPEVRLSARSRQG
jgi:microcystin degradation protein MlrC